MLQTGIEKFGMAQVDVFGFLPFPFCENDVFGNYLQHDSIPLITFKTCMLVMTERIEAKIKARLPSKCAIVIDLWTDGDTHYIGVFVTYACDNNSGYEKLLPALSPIGDEDDLGAS